LLILFCALPLGCRHKTLDVAPITAEDESLRKNESELLAERGALQRERKTISDERAAIVEKRAQLKDPAAQATLDADEKKLLARESDLTSKEQSIDGKLDEILRMRGDLVQRATQVAAVGASGDPLERAAKREAGVATRERDLATRERTLSDRERELAAREATLAKREHEMCGGQVMATKMVVPPGLKYSARDVEPLYKKALRLMQEKGILTSDLPTGTGKLLEETREAMKKADYVRAKYDAEQLLSTLEEIKIDRSFISAKMARLSAAMQGKKLDGGDKKTVESLFQEATANYGDGKFGQANNKINRLFALLKAG
jgi:hypothetical protein